MRKLTSIVYLAMIVTSYGAIARTQNVSATANTVAITSTSAGDIIVAFAYFAGTATIPTLPAGFTTIASQAGTAQAFNSGYKISTGGDTSSGVWTNATQVVCMVYSGVGSIGAVAAAQAGNGLTITYAAVTPQNASGSSWVLGFAGAASATAGMTGTPTGTAPNLGNRTSQVKANGCDTGTGITGFTAQTLTYTTTGRWLSITFELRVPTLVTGQFFQLF